MQTRLHPMGCSRALTAMDLDAIRARIARAGRTHNATLRQATKDAARRQLDALRDLRRIIGPDGYRLP